MPPLAVALAYDGLCTFEFGVAVEVFGLPRPELGPNWYRFAVAALDPRPLRATGGIRIEADGGLDLLDQADVIVIPGWRGAREPVAVRLSEALRRADGRGARILSICSGAFVLAAALSLWPTLAFLRWRHQLRADAAWSPDPAQVARLRTIVRLEFALIAVILVCAAAMARHGGLSF